MRLEWVIAFMVLGGCQALRQGAWQESACFEMAECPDVPCRPPTDATPRVYLKAGSPAEVPFYVEVAASDEARTCGLMDRRSLAEDWGMLFVFASARPRSFWMHRTAIPLDMIFADEWGKIVALAVNAQPYDETPRYESVLPARYVLEVRAGTVSRLEIQVGQRLTLAGVAGSHHLEVLH